ncbi:MAG: hypothetical protein ACT4NL_14650 [Pseudomarimonas sp.]
MIVKLGWRSRLLPALLRRWLAALPPLPRRGQMGSTSLLRERRLGAVEIECYRLQLAFASGVGASIYVHTEEVLRVDCLGAGGHFHLNLRQSSLIAAGAVMRIAFLRDSVAEQVIEAGEVIRRNLRQAIACNWHPRVREQAISDEQAAQLAVAVVADLQQLLTEVAHSVAKQTPVGPTHETQFEPPLSSDASADTGNATPS